MSEKKVVNAKKVNNKVNKNEKTKKEKRVDKKVTKEKKHVYEVNEKFITKGRQYGDIILRIPVEFGMFGKLKSHSKKIIFSMLRANEGLFCYNFRTQYRFNKCIKQEDLEKYINQLNKNKDLYEYEDPKTYKLDYFFYCDKKTNEYFYALNVNQLAESYSMWKMDQEYLDTMYIPLKHNVYGSLDSDNKNEFNLIGSIAIVNRSTNLVKHFTHSIKANYRLYASGKMYENRNLNNNRPFVDYKGKPIASRKGFGSLIVTYVIKNKKHTK